MKKLEFQKLLKKKILIADGATGSELQKYNLPNNICPEELNLTHPDIIYKVAKSYVDAGSDIILTNTLGGNRVKIKHYNLENKIKEVNQAAVKIAQKARGNKNVLVAASIGTTGKLLQPEGALSIDDAYNAFYEQIKYMVEAGVDIILIETQTDIEELKTAIRAAKQFDIGIVAQMTFTQGSRTLTGSTAEILCTVAEGLDVDVVGINCSAGPEGLYPIFEAMSKFTPLSLSIQPNAGLPYIENGKTIFPATTANMAKYAEKFYNLGANIIGGCCGSTPKHIAEIAKRLKNKKPIPRTFNTSCRIASRNILKLYGDTEPVILIGERINPTGKKQLTKALRDNDLNYIIETAKKQAIEKADVLDVNIGTPDVDEKKLMKDVLQVVQNASQLPVVIDSSFPEVIKKNYKYIYGKGVINSINGKKKILDSLLPVVKESGFSVIILTIDEKGIPDKAVDRMKITEKIVKQAIDYGIRKENLIIDPLVMTISSNPNSAIETIKAIKLIKKELQIPVSLGISNISFGLPNRDVINSAFFASTITAGLDMVIMNPASELMQQTKLASDLLSQRDSGAKIFLKKSIAINLQLDDKKKSHKKSISSNDADPLYQSILNGNKENIIDLIKDKKKNLSAFEIINKILIPAITEVGDLYNKGIYFLPQLIQSAQAMEKAIAYINKNFPKNEDSKGRLLICTVEGDIHSIGKNIVSMLLENHGYEINDLGVDIKYEQIKKHIKKKKPEVILLSALMTTTMMNMEEIINKLKKDNFDIPVVIGGAVVTEDYAKKIDAHYGGDAVTSVKVIKKLLQ